MKDLGIDVAGLSETNTAWQHQHIKAEFRSQAHRQHKLAKVAFGHPTVEVDPAHISEHRQYGGNLTMTMDSWVSKVESDVVLDSTGLGRCSGLAIRGKNKTKLTIITGYRVCKGSKASAPIDSSLLREFDFFEESGIRHPNPRQLFFDDLQKQIHSLQDANHRVVLMLDANERLSPDSEFKNFLQNCNLHDLQDSDPAQSTYILHSESRLDYMFGCTAVKNAVKRQGTLAYSEGPQADHRGLFADLDIRQLLGEEDTTPTVPAAARLLKSGNPELVKSYNSEMRKYYSDHKMTERIRALFTDHHKLSNNSVRKLLNQWDADQGRAMHHAESTLRSPPRQYEWSNKLRNAGLHRRYWRL